MLSQQPQSSSHLDRFRSVLRDESLSREEKQSRLVQIDPKGDLARNAVMPQLKTELRSIESDLARKRSLVRSLELYRDWETVEECRYILQKNDCSRLHKLKEAFSSGLYYDGKDGEFIENPNHRILSEAFATFVVRHDWAAAFEGAVGLEEDIKLPYDHCAFEFRVTGKNIILMAMQAPGAGPVCHLMFEGMDGVWFSFSDEGAKEIGAFLWKQVRAICVALDAKVAEHSVIRAPAKVNAKREKAGKPAIADFHVVDLSRRSRASARPDAGHTGRRVRMHFRRGHWRHYETHTTWINWMLVGDPDLGFIDKHYRI